MSLLRTVSLEMWNSENAALNEVGKQCGVGNLTDLQSDFCHLRQSFDAVKSIRLIRKLCTTICFNDSAYRCKYVFNTCENDLYTQAPGSVRPGRYFVINYPCNQWTAGLKPAFFTCCEKA